LGNEGFRRGTDLYFDRNDGRAVTTDDFVAALADANDRDFTQFKRWYTQAGTPRLQATGDYDASAQTYTLTFRQFCPATPGQPEKLPMVIPVAVGLLDEAGHDLPLNTESAALSSMNVDGESTTAVLAVSEATESVTFTGIAAPPVASLLRGFSAPVILETGDSDEELAFLAAQDNDPYNRWAAGQKLCMNQLLSLVTDATEGVELTMDPLWLRTFESVLADDDRDPALRAEMLRLPDEAVVMEQIESADPDAIHRARDFTRHAMGEGLREAFLTTYHELEQNEAYAPTAAQIAKRSLRNACLSLLSTQEDDEVTTLIRDQFASATNMTDRLSALRCLVHSGRDASDALGVFYEDFREEGLVIDSWFAVQAANPSGDGLARVKQLMEHPDFDLLLPNRVRAVVASFCAVNVDQFHRADGAGYEFLADQLVAIDGANPNLSARMAGMFSRWQKVEPKRQALARLAMERVLAKPKLSRNAYEVLSKTLKG
jgi:aminopeptidase N